MNNTPQCRSARFVIDAEPGRSLERGEQRTAADELPAVGRLAVPLVRAMRIVLVDDSPRFLRLLERALAAEPRLRVVGRARSGAEALAQVARLQPDLVLMDLVLPGMNGIEATRRLKAQRGAPQVILVTLYDTPQHRAAAVAAGVDHYLCKATLHTDLWPLLNELLA